MGVRDEIEAMLARRTAAMARFDTDEVVTFYIEDCEVVIGDMPTLSGRARVREFFASMFAEGSFEPAFAIQDLRVEGSLAVLYARELLTLQSKHDETLDQYAMRHMAVLTRETGQWLFVRSMVTLEGPGLAEVVL